MKIKEITYSLTTDFTQDDIQGVSKFFNSLGLLSADILYSYGRGERFYAIDITVTYELPIEIINLINSQPWCK